MYIEEVQVVNSKPCSVTLESERVCKRLPPRARQECNGGMIALLRSVQSTAAVMKYAVVVFG